MLETKASPSVQFLLVQNSGQGWQLALWISDRTQNKTGTFSSRQEKNLTCYFNFSEHYVL